MFNPEYKNRTKKSDARNEVSEVLDQDQMEMSFCSLFRAEIDKQVFSAILLLQQLSLHLHVKLFFCKFT